MSDSTATMNVVEISKIGGPEVLVQAVRPLPELGPGDVLVKVAAAGVNRADVLQRKGFYPPSEGVSDIPGLEVAGTVAAVAKGVERWRLGDKVCALVAAGGYAEYCRVPEPQVLPVPSGLSLLQAAVLPETFFTVWDNVFERAGLKRGEQLLVHGGGGGIGTTAIQLGNAFGADVYVTAGGAEKCAKCEALGAKFAIDYDCHDFVTAILEATGGQGVDVILDIVGGDYLGRNLQLLRPNGRLALIGLLRGRKSEVNIAPMLNHGLTVFGSVLRKQPVVQKGRIAEKLEEKVWPLLAARRLEPVLDRVFPLTKAGMAHAYLESGGHFGKIVLSAESEV